MKKNKNTKNFLKFKSIKIKKNSFQLIFKIKIIYFN
jgi:hypothetical protein